MIKLYNLFITKDIVLLEINPLTEAADGKVYCSYFLIELNVQLFLFR
jgi:succinyl-CoA synthetase beta subunit